MWLAVKILTVVTIAYAMLVAAAYLAQRHLMYFPETLRTQPADTGLTAVDEVLLKAPDGAYVIAWWAKATPGQPTLLYFHGNAGSLAFRAERIRRYQARGRGILMMSYRGYSGSTGKPSEAANVADALRAHDWLTVAGVPGHEIVLYGESLGSGVAVQVAAQRPVAGVVLDAPYTSVADVGAMAYPFLPVWLLLRDRYDSLAVIQKLSAPLLIVHGERDTIVPVEMGRRLHAAAVGPKQIMTFPLAGHADHYLYGSYEAINAWIDRIFSPSPARRD
jgi:fermentation-respiration switch protein FrsA (DUF1100 family)